MPFMGILAFNGFNFITEQLLKARGNVRKAVAALLLLYVVVFPFMPNPAAIHYQKDLMLLEEQKLAATVADSVKARFPGRLPLSYTYNYFSMVFPVDLFDAAQSRGLTKEDLQLAEYGRVIIWDNKFGYKSPGRLKEELDADTTLSAVYSFRSSDFGGEIHYVVYVKK